MGSGGKAIGRRARGTALLVGAIVATILVTAAPAAQAHTPHDDTYDVAISPSFSSDRTVIAISRGLFMRSTDGGLTWQRLVKGLDNRAQPYAVAYAGATSSRVYAVAADGVFRSDDGGTGWRRILTPPVSDLRTLATSTASPDLAVVSGSLSGASITTDGGTTWRPLNASTATITSVAFKKASQQVILAGDANGVLHVTGNTGTTWQHSPLAGAGAITSIALSPSFGTNGQALIGTDAGGVLRWDQNTRTATPVNTGLTDLRVTSVAYSANHGWDATVFASTWTGGLFVSHDRGTTWSPSNTGLEWNPQASTPGFLNRPNFGRVAGALTNTVTREQTVFLMSFTGVYLSTDLGQTWDTTETLSTGIIVGLGLSPQYGTDHKLAISTYVNGAFTSADGGGSWAESNLGLAQRAFWDDQPDSYARLHNIIYAPPVNGRSWLYSSVAAQGGAPGGVLRSSNDGASWSITTVPGFSNPVLDPEVNRIPLVLPSPSFATDRTVMMADGGNGAVYRSTDEGASFQQIATLPRLPRCLQASPTFATDHRLLACTNAGVYVSTDMGVTWAPTRNLNLTDLAVVAQTGVGQTWLAATANGLYRSTDLGGLWTRVTLPAGLPSTAEILTVAASPPSASPATVLVTVKGRGLLRSTNGGATFGAPSTTLLDANEQLDNFNYKPTISAIAFSPAFGADQTVFGFSNDKLFKSTDGGVTWGRVLFPHATHSGPFPVKPAAPAIGSATAGRGSASVTFTPGADGFTPIVRFDATCTSSNEGATGTGTGTASPVVVNGLTNGKTYTCRVTATNGIGTGPGSALSNAVVPVSVPGAPTAATAVAGTGQATVSWTAPASDGGSPITGYLITPIVGFYPLTPIVVSSPVTTHIVTGLTSGVTYRFKVAAVNAVGTGPTGSASNATVPS